MKTASSFHSISSGAEGDGPLVSVRFNGQELSLPEGANLAASLLAHDIRVFRQTPVSATPRGPFCMMGACFDCLVLIDGITQQACQCQVREGMIIEKPAQAEGENSHV
ncbi:(2Fe-2S)-binding protein [uncultured Cohaesibacter sp.]|uniref:(2Fe-2S)-binding protein n=1 Tax=uncultured Cohaesibacter sp. TaxID=1002546 RepID=UPI002AA92337|nr:(2Fe-2S)-binding protein [uncultured Cohaesibacter sp.]